MTRRPSDLKAAGRFFQQAIPPRKFVPSPKIAFLSLNAPTIPFLPPLPSLFLQSNLPSSHVFPNQRFLVVSQVKPIESAIRLLSTEALGAKVKIKKEEKRKKKREELSPSLSNGHLDPSPTAARGKRARSHPRVPFVPFRCTRGERGRRRKGGGTLDWIDASRGIPQFARTVLNVPEEMLAIARTRTSLAFYTGHAIVSSAGTPCKVTNDCREDSRRRVLNKDPRRLDYPRPSYLSHLFTCRFTHPVRRSTLRPWQPCGVPLLFEIGARGRWRRGSFLGISATDLDTGWFSQFVPNCCKYTIR